MRATNLSGPFCRRLFATACLCALAAAGPLPAADVYWDVNDTIAGAGGFTPAGTWDAAALRWNNAAGTGTASAWVAGDTAVFAAGTNAGGAYQVTVNGTQSIGGLLFEEGRVTLAGPGTLQLTANADFNVAANLTATINASISGAFNVTKSGGGTLVLGGANSYTGRTILSGGILSISADSNLGTASALAADSLTFGGGSLLITGNTPFVLNSNRGITLQAATTGLIQVEDAANTVTYGGVITGAAGTTFRKAGAGTLSLEGNSGATLLGALQVGGGVLRLSGAGTLAGVSSVALSNRGVLTLDNSGTNLGDRLAATAFSSNGGTLNFTHNSAAGTNYAEALGAVTLNAGALTVNTSQAATGQTSLLTLASIARNAGGTLYVTGAGLGANTQNSLLLTTAPALTNTLLPYAVVNNGTVTRFATHGGNGTSLTAQTAGYTAAQASWTTATINALPTATQTMSGNRTAYTLTLDNGIGLGASTADRSLTLSGAVLQSGGSSTIAASGSNENILAFGANEAIFHTIGDLIIQTGGTNNITGTGGLTKSGPGTLTVSRSSTTGVFRFNEGLYRGTAVNTAFGAAGASMEFNGGNIAIANDTNLVVTSAGAIQVNADATITVDRLTSGAAVTHTLPGALTIGGQTLTIAAGANMTADTPWGLTFSSATGVTFTGPATFAMNNNGTGAGTLTFSGPMINAGGHRITKLGSADLVSNGTSGPGGVVDMQGGRYVWNNTTEATTITDNNSIIGGAAGVLKSGASTVVLTGANAYTGPTSITNGVLRLDFGNAAVTNDIIYQNGAPGVVSLSTAATATLSTALRMTGKDAVNNSQTFGGLNIGGGLTLLEITSGAGGRMDANLGLVTTTGDGLVRMTGPATGDVRVTNANGLLGSWATYNGAWAFASSGLLSAFSGDLVYATGVNIADLGGYTTASNLNISAASTGNVLQGAGVTGLNTVSMTDTTAARLLPVGAGNTLRLGAAGGIQIVTGAGQLTVGEQGNAGTLTAGGTDNTAGTLNLTNMSTSNLVVNSVIADNGTGQTSVVLNGSGVTVFNGANTYGGSTAVQAGTLQLRHSNALGGSTGGTTVSAAAALQLANSISVAEPLVLTGSGVPGAVSLASVQGDNSLTRTITLAGATTVINAAADATLTLSPASGHALDGVGQSVNFGGGNVNTSAITINGSLNLGTGTLRTAGTGGLVLTLNADSRTLYSGTTTVSSGDRVVAGHSGALGDGAVTVTGTNTVLELVNGVNIANNITIANSGNNKVVRLQPGATAAEISGGITSSDASTAREFDLDVGAGGTLTVSGIVGGTGAAGVEKTGAGTLILSNNNTYTGTTQLTAGTTIIHSSSGLGAGTALTLSAGVLQGNGSGTKTLAQNVTQATGSFTIGGTDKFIFNGTWLTSGGTRTLVVDSTGGVDLNGTMTLGETTNNRTQVIAGSGNVLIAGIIQNNAGAATPAGAIQYNGTGVLTVTNGSNSYTGTTSIINPLGTFRVSGAGVISTGSLVVRAGLFDIAGSADQTVGLFTLGGVAGAAANVTLATGRTLTVNGSGTDYVNYDTNSVSGLGATISGGTLRMGATQRNFNIENVSSADPDLTIASVIEGTGLDLIKTGSGQMKLTGTNTYTGNTQLNGGLVEVTSLANLGVGSVISFNAGTLRWASGSTFDVSARTTTFTGSAGFDTNGNDVTLAAAVGNAGAGSLVKSGLGTLNLSINNQLNYTGTTTVTGGTLDFNGTTQTMSGFTIGGGPVGATPVLDLGTGGVLNLAGTVTYTSTNNNVAVITGGVGSIIDFGGAARTFNIGNGTNEIDLLIESNVTLQNDGGFGLIKTGAGTLKIDGTNNLTGPIDIQAGAVFGNVGTGNLVLNNGVFETGVNFTRALGTGSNQVQWAAGASGGFSARGGPVNVTFAGAPNPLVWDSTPSFVSGAGALLFGSITADNVVTFTHNIDLNNTGAPLTRTVSVVDNTVATTDLAVLSGVLSNSSGDAGLTKTGNGILRLANANTFTGAVTVTAGTLQFSTVTNAGGAVSNLGQGTGISLGGGRLQFIGSTSQSTDRVITLTASSTLDASGTGGAVITYNGAINGASTSLTLDGTGDGVLNGLVTQSSTSADLIKSGTGTWRIDTAQTALVDDIIINAGTLVANVANFFTADDIFIRNGTLKLTVNGAITTSVDDLNVSNETASGGVLDLAGTTGSAPTELRLGSATLTGSIIDSVGGGSIGGTFSFFNGLVSANLTGAGTLTKSTTGTVTLSGANAGFTGATTVTTGELILDYTANNGEKLSDTATLTSGLATLTMKGSNSAPTVETVGGFVAGTGRMQISVQNGTGQTAALNLGAITRAAGDGLVNFTTSSASATVTTTTTNTAGTLLGGWATLNRDSFATVSGGVISAAISTVKNDVTTWAAADDVRDSTGFTGTTGNRTVNSLLFGSASTSTVGIEPRSRLTIGSGGILVTPSVGAATASITGGILQSGAGGDVIVTQNNTAATFGIGSSLLGTTLFTKGGEGNVLLSGTNFYSGFTSIQEGTLTITGGNAIGDRSLVRLAVGAGVTLDASNVTETIGGLSGGASGGVVMLGESGVLTVANLTGSSQVYGGVITGGAGSTLIFRGTSNQELEGDSTGFLGSVIVNSGLLHLDSSGGAVTGATSITLNGSTSSVLSDQDQAGSENKIGDTAAIFLNNTGGGNGLRVRNENQASARSETVGAITIGAGHNVIMVDAASAANTTDRAAVLVGASLARTNRATVLVRGLNLGGVPTANVGRGSITITGGFTGALAAVGGGGAAGTKTISILPYMIGDASSSTGLGNSFVTADGSNALRPLNLTTEYTLNETDYNALTGVVTDNVRFAANPTATLTGGSKTINSLVLDSSASALTVNGGSADTLTLTSGALLATTSTGANAISLGGFSNLLTATNEYLVYVTNATNTLTLGSALTTTTAGLTKSGAGTLVLSNTGNTYGGGTWFNQGVIIASDLANLGTGNLNFFGGTLRWGVGATFDASVRTMLLGQGGGVLDTNGNNVTLGSSIGAAGVGGLTKAGAGVLTLNLPATYKGDTAITGGTLAYGANNALPTGTSVTMSDATTLDHGVSSGSLGNLTLIGATGNIIGSAGGLTFTGDVTNSGGNRTLVVNSASNTTFNGGYVFLSESASARTFTMSVTGSGNVVLNNVITDGGAAASNFGKTGSGVLIVGGLSTYTGTTNVDNGTLRLAVEQALPGTTALRVGNGATAATFDMGAFNQAVGGLTTLTSSTTLTNQLLISSGKTLTVNGSVTLGANAATSTTRLTASGGGALVVNSDGGTFQVGGATGSTNINVADINLASLASLTANLGSTGVFRVGDNNANSAGSVSTGSTLILPVNNTITAGTLGLGDQMGQQGTGVLVLGSGSNLINVDTVNLGAMTGTRRAGGTLQFDAADTTGTLTLRASSGLSTSRVALFTMINTNASTSTNQVSLVDLNGHTADVRVDVMNMAFRTASTGSATAELRFNQGSLDINTLTMASRTSTGTGGASATLNLGDSAAPGVPTTLIGSLIMAINTSSGGTVGATINISGGNVTFGTGAGTAVNMANAGTSRTVTSSINITSTGKLTVDGAIVRTGGAGTENATVSLNGADALLDLKGNTLGATGRAITFVVAAGKLQNVGEINGGAGLNKTTGGTVILDGNNTYTGGTTITAGNLQVGDGGTTGNLGSGNVTNNGILTFNRSNAYSAVMLIQGTGSVAQAGVGSTLLTQANTYQGGTSVTAGTLVVGNSTGSATGTGAVTISGTGTVAGTGIIGGDVAVNSGGTLAPGSSGAGQLTLKGSLSVASNGRLLFEIGGTTFNDAAFVFANISNLGSITVPASWENYVNGSTSHDHLLVDQATSLPTINGTIAISPTFLSDYIPSYGDIFDLVDWGITANMSGTPTFDLPNISHLGLGWNTSLFASNGIIVVTPEPGRTALVAGGLMLLALRRRRRCR